MRRQRMWSMLWIAVVLSLIVSGCGLMGYQGEYEAGVLRVWTTWAGDPEPLQALFDRYSQQSGQPVKVLTGVKGKKLQEALASDTPPEIIILSSSEPVGAYAGQNLVEPLDSWIERAGIPLDDFYPAPLARCESGEGVHLCLPLGGDVFALYWNKDLFRAAGLDPERPPQTMEELVDYAGRLTLRNEAGEISQVGFLPDFPRPHTELYVRMLGGDLSTVNAQPVIDAENWQLQFFTAPGFEAVNELVTSLDRYGDSDHPVLGGARLNCQQCHREKPVSAKKLPEQGFYKGKVAMMVDAQWQETGGYLPALQPGLNYGVAPFPPPAANPERANTVLVQGPVVVIPAHLSDKTAAADLLAWMMSPEIMAEISDTKASLPARRTAAADPRFAEMANTEVFLDLMEQGNAGHLPLLEPEVQQALREVEQELLHEKGGDPAQRLDQIQEEIVKKP